jgi:hypothetical protein
MGRPIAAVLLLSPAAHTLHSGEKPMKRLQQMSMAVVLTLMLTTGVFAGIIHTPEAPPPPNSTLAHSSPTTESDTGYQQTTQDSFQSVMLNLLQTMLSVF